MEKSQRYGSGIFLLRRIAKLTLLMMCCAQWLLERPERIKEIQSEYGVRMDCRNRDASTITVKGVLAFVADVKGYLDRLKELSIEVPVASQLLPKLVGKKGVL